MKMIVLNGSPKGIKSITMQYVHYMQQRHWEHEFKIINISQKIKKIEKDDLFFQSIME